MPANDDAVPSWQPRPSTGSAPLAHPCFQLTSQHLVAIHDRAAINRRIDSHQLDYVFVPEQQKSAKCDIFIEETTR
jgi:hypothetical protein